MDRSNIVLIGMPGSGKSTIGEVLSNKSSRSFIDTDRLIEASEEKKLQDIVDDAGYLGFRRIEAEVIMKIELENYVIATGGSVIYSDFAMKHLRSIGVIVFLDIGIEDLKFRINNFDERGIVKLPGQTLEDLFEERLVLYKKYADITINCSHLTPEESCFKIMRRLNCR